MSSTAIVTGTGSGMGLATARCFVDHGWSVLGVDRDGDALDTASQVVGPAFTPLVADVTDRASLESALATEVVGREVKAVVNAAGVYPPSTLADFTEGLYRRVFDINVLGTLNVCAVVAPLLKAAGGGGIVNFASVDALAVSPGQLVYSASKAAVMSVTRSLAVELAPDGITVNGVAPGWVDTPGNAATGRMSGAAATIPLGRVADPAEIAHWVFQLARGSYVTGETLVISGGSLIR